MLSRIAEKYKLADKLPANSITYETSLHFPYRSGIILFYAL
jgi:hypothetical protein